MSFHTWNALETLYPDWNNMTTDSWHDTRNTSREVALAIHECADRNGVSPERVWDAPLATEESEVRARAFEIVEEIGEVGVEELYWGEETFEK